MPSIHVVYDPNDKITGLTPDQMKQLGASSIILSVTKDITIHNIDEIISQCTELLIERIAYNEAEDG